MKKLAGIEMFRTSVALGAGAQVLGSMGVSAAGLGNMGAAMPAVGSIQGAGILLDEVKRLRR